MIPMIPPEAEAHRSEEQKMKDKKTVSAALLPGDQLAPPPTAEPLPTSDAVGVCPYCGAMAAMCLYWKIHGYVACCPECTHGRKAEGRQP